MIAEGETLPDVRLAAADDAGERAFQLDRALDRGSVLLAYCPSRRLEESSFAGPLAFVPWFQFMRQVTVVIVTGDGEADPDRLAAEFRGLTIRSDVEGAVASALGIDDERADGGATHLALIAPSRTVTFSHRGGTDFDAWAARNLQQRIDRTRVPEARRTAV